MELPCDLVAGLFVAAANQVLWAAAPHICSGHKQPSQTSLLLGSRIIEIAYLRFWLRRGIAAENSGVFRPPHIALTLAALTYSRQSYQPAHTLLEEPLDTSSNNETCLLKAHAATLQEDIKRERTISDAYRNDIDQLGLSLKREQVRTDDAERRAQAATDGKLSAEQERDKAKGRVNYLMSTVDQLRRELSVAHEWERERQAAEADRDQLSGAAAAALDAEPDPEPPKRWRWLPWR